MNALAEAKQKLNPKDALLYASAQHMELLLDVTAQVVDMYSQFSSALTSEILKAADADGNVLPYKMLNVQDFVNRELSQLNEHYRNVLFDAMSETVSYVQGAHLALYDYYLGDKMFEERKSYGDEFKGKYPHVDMFNARQREEVINAARSRQYDGRNLSDRLWNLENGGKEKINQRLLQAITNKESAVSLAKDLEQYLKPDVKGTRWSHSRLYKMTSKGRAISKKGLTSIKPGMASTKGMSYNALRLARNEVQQIHWDTYKQTTETMPWVEEYSWMLGSGHPRQDVCDGLASSGPYKKGSVPNRPHPQCYCWLRVVMMDKDKFISDVKGWMQGKNTFLDEYAKNMGFDFGATVNATMASAEEKLRSVIKEKEAEIRYRTVNEKGYAFDDLGNVIFSKVGGKDFIEIAPEEQEVIRGIIFTHNHPKIASFSDADIRMGAKLQQKEVRAVDAKYIYSMKPPENGWSREAWRDTIEPSFRKAYDDLYWQFKTKLNLGLITKDEFWEVMPHEVWERVSQETGLTYKRILWE